MSLAPLHVIAVVSNPIRFESRYRLFSEFKARMLQQPSVVLHTVELAYGKRPYEITTGAEHEYQFRTHEEIWHKENLINLGLQRLPEDWEYVAWIDADVAFARPDWAVETVHQLQHYKVVQMFTHATDLGPEFEPLATYRGYIHAWQAGIAPAPSNYYDNGKKPGGLIFHPGYAWAARRDALDNVGGMIDFAILGSGDTHMAGAFTGVVDKTFYPGMNDPYKNALQQYQRLCENYIRRKVGFVDTHLTHYWHGKKKDRGYSNRWKILSDNEFDPYQDIFRDTRGLIRLTGEKRELRDGMMKYFRSRSEDSIDL